MSFTISTTTAFGDPATLTADTIAELAAYATLRSKIIAKTKIVNAGVSDQKLNQCRDALARNDFSLRAQADAQAVLAQYSAAVLAQRAIEANIATAAADTTTTDAQKATAIETALNT
jgi:hypothetical protein